MAHSYAIKREPETLALLSIRSIRQAMETAEDVNLFLTDPSFVNLMRYFLQCHGNEALQLEAGWIFTNIAAGKSSLTQLLFSNNVIPDLINLMHSPNLEIVEQVMWCLGNVLGDGPGSRDKLIQLNFVESLVQCANLQADSVSFTRVLAWTFMNLVRFHDHPLAVAEVQKIVPGICKLFCSQRDLLTGVDCLWSLTYITECGVDYIQTVLDNGIIPRVMNLLAFGRIKVKLAAVRLLGNIAAGTDSQASLLLDQDLLANIHDLVYSPSDKILSLTLWCLSNISVGPAHHVQAIIDSDLMPGISKALENPDQTVVMDTMKIIHNLVVGCRIDLIRDIVDLVTVPLINLSKHRDEIISNGADEVLFALFYKVERHNHSLA